MTARGRVQPAAGSPAPAGGSTRPAGTRDTRPPWERFTPDPDKAPVHPSQGDLDAMTDDEKWEAAARMCEVEAARKGTDQ